MVNSSTETEKIVKKLTCYLQKAWSILCNSTNQDEYKDYIIPLVFFKRINDLCKKPDREFIFPKGCHWTNIRKASTDVGQVIANAMNGVEKANPDTLGGIFSSFDNVSWTDKSKLDDERLLKLVKHMSRLKLSTDNYSNEVMGKAFNNLIDRFAKLAKKSANEYYTPRNITKLMVQLLEPKSGKTVYDPTCGTGGLLTEAFHYNNNSQTANSRFYGQESNLSAAATARISLFLHGVTGFKIAQGDTLRQPKFIENDKLQQFNYIFANPPFIQEGWWLQHMIKSMKPGNSKIAIAVSQGMLFRTGKDGEIREKIIKSDLVEAVITLPSGVFYGDSTSTCILYLNNNKKDKHKGKICFIDAPNEDAIRNVLDLYKAYIDVPEKCKIATLSKVENAGYVLTANTYIEKEKHEPKEPAVVRKEYLKAIENVRQAEAKMKSLLVKGGFVNEC